MEVIELSQRHIIFKAELEGWDLHLHLIKAQHQNYLIDTGIGEKSLVPIWEYLKGETKPLVIINTHYHWDHIYGNYHFSKNLIVSHQMCRELSFETWQESLVQAKAYTDEIAEMKLANLVFDHQLVFPEDDLFLFHTPGHTLDGISIYDAREGVLNMGDNLGDTYDEIVPTLDSSKAVYLESLNKCKELEPKICISGHCGIQKPDILDKVIRELE